MTDLEGQAEERTDQTVTDLEGQAEERTDQTVIDLKGNGNVESSRALQTENE